MHDTTAFDTTDELNNSEDLEQDQDSHHTEIDGAVFESELANSIKTIEGYLQEIARTSYTARYLLGREVLSIQNNARYGENAVEFLSGKLRISARTLRTHAHVVSVWPDQQRFDEMTMAQRPGARPMGWSHVVELATAEQSRRDDLIKRTIDEGLTIEQLRAAKAEACVVATAASSANVAPAADMSATEPETRASGPLSAVAPASVEAEEKEPETAGEMADEPPTLQSLETAIVGLAETLSRATRAQVDLSQPKHRKTCLAAIQTLRLAADALEARLSTKRTKRLELQA